MNVLTIFTPLAMKYLSDKTGNISADSTLKSYRDTVRYLKLKYSEYNPGLE